jgi:acyl-CoA synthetase (AMP-forming)/AMP-acid ligase II
MEGANMSFKAMLAEADPDIAARAAVRMAHATVGRQGLPAAARAQAQQLLDLGVDELAQRIRAKRAPQSQAISDHASISSVLRMRAATHPNDPAFTFVDYENDPDGVQHTITWSQLRQEVITLAAHIREHATVGDRVGILTPQSMSYIVSVLGCLEANVIAVPMSLPIATARGDGDRGAAIVGDARPAVLLTTTDHIEEVAPYAVAEDNNPTAKVLAVDALGSNERTNSASAVEAAPTTAYLQYTSGTTRAPVGVMVSQRNLFANFEKQMSILFNDYGKKAPPDTTAVSWLPFYHDMGLFLGIFAPVLGGWHSVVMSPIAFLQRPARWLQQLSIRPKAVTAAPNFALELAARRTTDNDLAELDLGDVVAIVCGSERVQPATVERFSERFAGANLPPRAIRPAYGLAEATLFVAAHDPVEPAAIATFDSEKLTSGTAKRTRDGTGLYSYGLFEPSELRIVDLQSRVEKPATSVGEIWIRGDSVCSGYWNRPDATEATFGGVLVGEPAGLKWLRTGDLGFLDEGELFIVGRVKDLMIIRGRNHSPDEIEATVQELVNSRVAAISVPDGSTQELVTIIELKSSKSTEEFDDAASTIKMEIWQRHGASPADVVFVREGSIPMTSSGKVRRSAAAEMYRLGQLARLDT